MALLQSTGFVGHVMSGSFDPYDQWLGISRHDQPANHYRLLGLELFEADLEVIKHAADRRIRQIEQVRSDEHQQAATKLLKQGRLGMADPTLSSIINFVRRLLWSIQYYLFGFPL